LNQTQILWIYLHTVGGFGHVPTLHLLQNHMSHRTGGGSREEAKEAIDPDGAADVSYGADI
jgi:hypothetical protein